MAGGVDGGPRSSSPILELVCTRCIDDLGAAHATVALAGSDGLWSPAYASSRTAAALEEQAFTAGEGPCYDALRDHSPVLVGDLDSPRERDRWPVWGAAAQSVGVRSVAALPIQAGALVAGALTLFSAATGTLQGARLTRALRLADFALLGLLDLLSDLQLSDAENPAPARGAEIEALSPEVAELVRAEVHQAAGMIMVQAGVPIVEALVRLRAHAFSTGRPLTDVAGDVLTRRISFAPDADCAQ